jgi:hypothetical protein
MVKVIRKNKEVFYSCEVCGLKYAEKKKAQECESWCRKHNSCNLDIIKNAVKE